MRAVCVLSLLILSSTSTAGENVPVEVDALYDVRDTLVSWTGNTADNPVVGPGYSVYCSDNPVPPVGTVEEDRVRFVLNEVDQTAYFEEQDGDSGTGTFVDNRILFNIVEDDWTPTGYPDFYYYESYTLDATYDPETGIISGTVSAQQRTRYEGTTPPTIANCANETSFSAQPVDQTAPEKVIAIVLNLLL